MSIILGLNCNHADSSACIFKDGKLLFAIEEERINRIKHWAGLPLNSINECLEYTNIDVNEITDISINTNPLSNLNQKIFFFLKSYIFGKKKYEFFKRLKKKVNIKNDINKNLKQGKLNDNVKLHYIDHHLSHIASAFYPSGFEKANGLSIDGSGDFVTCAIAECEKNSIKIKKKTYFPHSLGIFYHGMTQFLGFNNYGDEYKIMGLAAYGKAKFFDKIKDNLFIDKSNDLFNLNLEYFNHQKPGYKYIA